MRGTSERWRKIANARFLQAKIEPVAFVPRYAAIFYAAPQNVLTCAQLPHIRQAH